MLRRLHKEQPASFAFTPANFDWAQGQIAKYPEGRQASAIIPLLWRAQEQEGWLTRPAIEYVATLLGLAYIRALEVATFYFMFQLQPVGTVAHIQICGTTTCMICGAEDLIAVCKEKIAAHPHTLSADGRFSWEEVECLGACSNAPMAQIGKDYYEDLTSEKLRALLDRFAAGDVPVAGPQNGRYAAEPLNGLTALKEFDSGRTQFNASVQRSVDVGDGIKRIDGTEVPLITPWIRKAAAVTEAVGAEVEPTPGAGRPADATGVTVQEAPVTSAAAPKAEGTSTGGTATAAPGQNVAGEAKKPETTIGDAAAATGIRKPDTGTAPKAGDAMAQPASLVSAVPATGGDLPGTAQVAPTKPVALEAARGGKGDDLKIIEGIGPKLESLCHSLGIFHFDQIAGWTEADIAWMDSNLTGFRGRVTRDKWVAQARLIGQVGIDEFLRRAKTNDY